MAIQKLHEEVIDCFNTRDPERLLSLHTDDFILMEQNMPAMIGKTEVKKLFDKLNTDSIDFTLSFNINEIEIFENRAFVRGQVIKHRMKNELSEQLKGKFMSLLRKQEGRWLRTHVMANTDAHV